ncbi:MAG TPA: hypothetical protein VG893_07740 [Terracidiphilus sp.]|nr:hypothetical protein [Terracidiphilus sp.]
MATTEPCCFSLVKTGASSWAAVLVRNEEQAPTAEMQSKGTMIETHAADSPAQMFLAEDAARGEIAERFPRLAIAMVAFLLFAVSLTAEIEYLRESTAFLR